MEIHKFYLYEKDRPNRLTPTLYAFTADAKLAKAFIDSRNENLFTHLCDTITEDMYKDVTYRFPNAQLKRTRFTSRSEYDPTETIRLPVVCTWEEETRVVLFKDDIAHTLGLDKFMMDTSCLPLEVNQALYELGYFYFYQWLYVMQYIGIPLGHYFDGIPAPTDDASVMFRNLKYDEFSIFMYMYGNTMK